MTTVNAIYTITEILYIILKIGIPIAAFILLIKLIKKKDKENGESK